MRADTALLVITLANLLIVGFGSVITVLSYSAYRSSGRRPVYRNSTLGFGLITCGGIVEPFYQLVVKKDYYITTQELLELQAAEGVLIGLGLGLLFLSIYGSRKSDVRANTRTFSAELDGDDR